MISTTLKKRPFSEWCGDMIEEVCARNDEHRMGHDDKPAWETESVGDLYTRIDQEIFEFIVAFMRYNRNPSEDSRKELQLECSDVAATVMMLSANIDPVMSGLRRGR